MSKYKNAVCRGSWALNNNCKTCERCIETKPMSDKKWKGCIGYDREGVEQYREFDTEAEAKAYIEGAQDAMTIAENGTSDEDINPLEDYWTSAFEGDFVNEQ